MPSSHIHYSLFNLTITETSHTLKFKMEVLRDALRAGSNAQEALQAMVAAAAGGSTTAPSSSAAAASNPEGNNNPSANEAANQEGQDDGIEVDDEITYTPYKPSKLKVR